MIRELPEGRSSRHVAEQVVVMLLPCKDKLKTIPTGNGTEFSAHELVTERLGVKVYFTDPYSAWQKGAIENANRLIRQFIPKGSSFKDYSGEQVKQIQYKLNNRPREKLDFSTPKVEFYKHFI